MSAWIFCLPAMAQERPMLQIFGGYSYMHANISLNSTLNQSELPLINHTDTTGGASFNGWNASLAVRLFKNVEAVLDAGSNYQYGVKRISSAVGYTDNAIQSIASNKSTNYSFLFGPQVRMFGEKKVSPFGRVLFGFSKQSWNHTTESTWSGFAGPMEIQAIHGNLSNTGFAMTAGGGIDWRCSKRISVRLIQAEYIRAEKNFSYNTAAFQGFSQTINNRMANSFRLSAGVVFDLKLHKK
jgi:hypothetical protein